MNDNLSILEEPQEQLPIQQPGFGFWATTGLGLIIMGVYFVITLIVAFVYGVFGAATGLVEFTAESIMDALTSGLFLSVTTIVTSIFGILMIIFMVKVKKGLSVVTYLGLGRFTKKAFIISILISIVFLALIITINWFTNDDTSSGWVDSVYTTAGIPVLLWIAIVLFGPAFEELFFRGFIFEGYRNSWLRGPGTIIVTAVIWSALHVQYDIYGILTIFAYGILFGIIRLKTRSVWITFFLHALFNFIALAGTAIVTR